MFHELLEEIGDGLRSISDCLAEDLLGCGLITADARVKVACAFDGQSLSSRVTISYGHAARYELGSVAAAQKLIKEKRKQNADSTV